MINGNTNLSSLMQNDYISEDGYNVALINQAGDIEDSNVPVENLLQKNTNIPAGNLIKYDSDGYVADSGLVADDVLQKDGNLPQGNLITTDSTGKVIDSNVGITDLAIKTGEISENDVLTADEDGKIISAGITIDDVVVADGAYEQMYAGTGGQLATNRGSIDKVSYLFRTSGGSADIGSRMNDKLVGGTVAFNQLADNNKPTFTNHGITFTNNEDGTWTVNGTSDAYVGESICANSVGYRAGHKLLISGGTDDIKFYIEGYSSNYGNDFIFSYPSTDTSLTRRLLCRIVQGTSVTNVKITPQCFDLTQMFGSAVADGLYAMEQATAGSGVALFKSMFPKSYYEYNTGELISVKTTAHEMTGFNQWDEEWEVGSYNTTTGEKISGSVVINKNPIRVLPNISYYFQYPAGDGNYIVIFQYDANFNYLGYKSVTTVNRVSILKDGTRFINFRMSGSYGGTYDHDICINISHSGRRNGEYEPYVKYNYPLADVELRGIPKWENGKMYYDGDTYEHDGTVTRKYGIVDLGTLNWTKQTSFFQALLIGGKAITGASGKANAICSKYECVTNSTVASEDKSFAQGAYYNTGSNVYIRDTAYLDGTASNFKAAMSGVYLVYERATPTTETADPFTDPQIVDDWGTEEYVDNRTIAVPVGHETLYMTNNVDKLAALPDAPSASGTYAVYYDKDTRSSTYVAVSESGRISINLTGVGEVTSTAVAEGSPIYNTTIDASALAITSQDIIYVSIDMRTYACSNHNKILSFLSISNLSGSSIDNMWKIM